MSAESTIKGEIHESASDYGTSPLPDDVVDKQQNKRQIGVTSATFLIFNRMIGTGIFAVCYML